MVQRDKANISRDYHGIVLPFMQRHPDLFRSTSNQRQFLLEYKIG